MSMAVPKGPDMMSTREENVAKEPIYSQIVRRRGRRSFPRIRMSSSRLSASRKETPTSWQSSEQNRVRLREKLRRGGSGRAEGCRPCRPAWQMRLRPSPPRRACDPGHPWWTKPQGQTEGFSTKTLLLLAWNHSMVHFGWQKSYKWLVLLLCHPKE